MESGSSEFVGLLRTYSKMFWDNKAQAVNYRRSVMMLGIIFNRYGKHHHKILFKILQEEGAVLICSNK